MAFRSTWSPGFAYLFRGGDQGIALGNNTLAVWFNWDDVNVAGYEAIEINSTIGGLFFGSAIVLSGDQIEYLQRSSTDQLQVLSGVINADQWYHAAVTYDGTIMRAYLNGVEIGNDASGLTGLRGNWSDVQVGPGLGNLQDAVFYTEALSAEEIQQLYAQRVPRRRANLRYWLPLFPGANRVVDYSGNGFNFSNADAPADATITGPPALWGPRSPQVVLSSGTSVAADGDGRTLFNGSGARTAAVAAVADGRTVFNGSGARTASAAKAGDGRTLFNGAASATTGAPADGRTVFNGAGARAVAVATAADGRTAFNGSATATAARAAAADGRTLFNGSATPAVGRAVSADGRTVFNGSGARVVSVAATGDGRTLFDGLSSAAAGLFANGETLFNGSATATTSVAKAGDGRTLFNGAGVATSGVAGIGQTLFNGAGSPSVAFSVVGDGRTLFNGSGTVAGGGGGIGIGVHPGLGDTMRGRGSVSTFRRRIR